MERTELTRLMHEVLDGAASADEVRELDRLLAEDPEAGAQFDQLERLFAGLNTMPKALPPEGLVAAVLAKLHRQRGRRDSRAEGQNRMPSMDVSSQRTRSIFGSRGSARFEALAPVRRSDRMVLLAGSRNRKVTVEEENRGA